MCEWWRYNPAMAHPSLFCPTRVLLLLLGLAGPALPQVEPPLANAADKLDVGLQRAPGRVAVFVRMGDQLFGAGGDYERFCAAQPEAAKRLEIRERVVDDLKRRSDRSFLGVTARLDRLVEQGLVRGIQRYWIVNGFACEATAAGCRALARLPEVGFVYRQRYGPQHKQDDSSGHQADRDWTNRYQRLLADRKDDRDEPLHADALTVPWNLKAVRADKAWIDHGVTGKGVVVAVLDDGMMTVPALLPALWHNEGEKLNGKDDDGNGYVDDVFGYDFRDNHPYSVTPVGHRHGTLCAGIIAARPTRIADPLATSVAPRAKVMPLIGGGQLRAYEYALDKGADILSMSYTLEPVKMGQYRGLYRMAHEHLAAAGVVSVGGAGNYAQRRPVGTQIGSPKDIPCVIAASGVGKNGKVSAFSSRGPVSWQGIRYYGNADSDSPPLSKPDVTACNAGFPMWTRKEVWTGRRANRLAEVVHRDDAGYIFVSGPRGNSFAGPHAAGVAALMLEANPDLPVWHLKRLLESTCTDMGEPGRDTTHGAGMMQADKAVVAARAFPAK